MRRHFILLAVIVTVLFSAISPVFAQDDSYDTIHPGAAVLLGTGMLFFESSGTVLDTMLFVEKDRTLSEYRDYLSATSPDQLGGSFNDGLWAKKLQIQSLSNFGAGILFTSSLFFFPDEQVTISIPGKIGLIAGLATVFAGNFFDFLSHGAYVESKNYAFDYENATSGASAVYDTYMAAYGTYGLASGLGLILKGVGGALTAASFILPGRKQPYFPSLLHKIMNAGGLLFITAGAVTKSIARNFVVQIPYAYEDYQNAGSNAAAAYEVYQDLNTAYTALTLTSYGLWIAGGSAIITALFLPAPSPSGGGELSARSAEKNANAASVSLLPVYNGNFGIGLTVSK